VRSGECVGLLGPNGAGKSTMLKMINGLILPNAGSITITGNVGAMIELGTGFNPILSGRENVYVNAAVLGIGKKEVDRCLEKIVEFAELGHVIDEPVKTYSSGMKMRLGFSIGANLRPQLLLIDEVLAVGDVAFRMKCFAHLRELVKSGIAIILVTHAVGMLNRVANRAIVFGDGNVIHDGDLETGCTVYEETMGASDRVKHAADPEPETTARVLKAEVVDDRGEPCKEFETGSTVAVKVTLTASESLSRMNLFAALCSPVHGRVTAVSTASHEIDFSIGKGQTVCVTLIFENIALLLGAFHFNISLYGPTSLDFYHRASGVGNFRIVGPPIRSDGRGIEGITKMPCRWRIGD
jgi:lipopolysaccharide transport system ATP-binding protein